MPKAPSGSPYRRFYYDADDGRLFFTDSQDDPPGVFVEQLDARDWYLRAGHSLSCGWPGEHHERDEDMCRCGFLFPHKAPPEMHRPQLSAEDEAALL